MKISVDEDLYLRLFDLEQVDPFFESIHKPVHETDPWTCRLREKYCTRDRVRERILDALNNKYGIDGTPDFYVWHQGSIAGVFEFHPLVDDKFIEIGFWLFPEFRNRQILSKVLSEMIVYKDKFFSSRYLKACTDIENLASQRLLVKNGFRRTDQIEEGELVFVLD